MSTADADTHPVAGTLTVRTFGFLVLFAVIVPLATLCGNGVWHLEQHKQEIADLFSTSWMGTSENPIPKYSRIRKQAVLHNREATLLSISRLRGSLSDESWEVLYKETPDLKTTEFEHETERYEIQFSPRQSLTVWDYIRYGATRMGMGVAAVLSLFSGIGVGLIRRDSTAPNNEEETEDEPIRPIREQSVAEIIQHQISENRHLEYKSVLHWHKYIEERYCNDTQHEVLRTVAGFLNTDGGTLLVGVEEQEDDQNGGIRYTPITVENDAFESEDEGKQHVVDIVPRLTPNPEHMGKIEVDYESAEGHRVLRIDCEPSHRPVFLADKRIGREEEQRFFKRAAAATIELEGAEMMDYIEDHFDDKWIRQFKQTLPENWT
jgi:hypothetical protein